MSTASALAPLLLLGMLMLAGRPLVESVPATRPLRWIYAVLAGWWLLHLLLTLLDLARVPWSVPLVAGALLLVALWRLRQRESASPSAPPGWGDVVALLAVLVFAALAATRWIAFSDFVYHWGIKGHRFLLAREAISAYAGWRHRQDFRSPASYWHFGTPQTDWLARCLAAADAAAEPGSRIVLLARKEDFFRGRWAAYLLPAHDVFTDRGQLAPQADLVVALNGSTFPGARIVGGGERCRLLRAAGRGPARPAEGR